MKIIILILTLISIFFTFSSNSAEDVLFYAILTKLFIFSFYLLLLIKNRLSVLLPNNLFITFFFLYFTAGEAIWLFRENMFYNTPGNPIPISKEILIVFASFSLINILFNIYLKQFKPINILSYYRLTQNGIVILASLGFIGLIIFTRGFTNIPILSDNIDKGRALVGKTSGVGIAFILLVSSVYIFIFKLSEYIKTNNYNLFYYIIIGYIPFLLYGGRSLFILPIFLFIVLQYSSKTMSWKLLIKSSISFFILIILTSSYSLLREYGQINLLDPIQLNFYFADLFPEFRSLVNTLEISNNKNFGNEFLPNLIYGQIPGGVFEILNLNKNDYYIEIGKMVTSNTTFADEFDGGIRLTLIGEFLIMSNVYKIISMIFLQAFLLIGTYEIFSNRIKRNSLNIILFSYYIVFSFPYGINFVMNAIQLYVFLLFMNKYVFSFSNRHQLLLNYMKSKYFKLEKN